MVTKSAPAKNKSKATSRAMKTNKTNVAKSGVLSKKLKFNWKIVGLIAVVLVLALGFLYVRLSRASGIGTISVDDIKKTDGASQGTKVNGTKVIYGPGFGSVNTYPNVGLGNSGGLLAYPDADTTYQVTLFDSDNDGFVARGNASITARCASNDLSVEQVTTGVVKAPFTLSLPVPAGHIKKMCGPNEPVKLEVGISTGDYITGIRVVGAAPTPVSDSAAKTRAATTPTSNPAPATTPPPAANPAAKAPAPATPTPLNCATMVNGQGNQNACVTFIQQRLKDLGYDPGTVDGIYGEKTTSAVKVFQSKSGLPKDGVVGTNTWNALASPNAARKS